MFSLQVGAPGSSSGEKVAPGISEQNGCRGPSPAALRWEDSAGINAPGPEHSPPPGAAEVVGQLWLFCCPVTSTCLAFLGLSLEKNGLSSWSQMGDLQTLPPRRT